MTEDKGKLLEKVKKYKDDSEKLSARVDTMRGKLNTLVTLGPDFVELVKELNVEVESLQSEANSLFTELDEFREKYGLSADEVKLEVGMNYAEAKKKLEEILEKFKTFKEKFVEQYNYSVSVTNRKIQILKNAGTTGNAEVDAQIAGLTELSTCNTRNWNDSSYLKNIDYKHLAEVNKLMNEIAEKTSIDLGKAFEVNNFDFELIAKAETKVTEIENESKEELTASEVGKLLKDLDRENQFVAQYETQLKNNIDNITEEKYNQYTKRVEELKTRITNLEEKLTELRKKCIDGLTDADLYKYFKMELSNVEEKVYDYSAWLDALGEEKVKEDALSIFKERLDKVEGPFESLKVEIEAKYKDGKLQKNQYEGLKKLIENIEKLIELAQEKEKNPAMVEGDIFEHLNKRLLTLDKDGKKLGTDVKELGKPIKKPQRKELDKRFKELEKEIARLEKTLKAYKDTDKEKYKETKAKLDEAKGKYDELHKLYRKNCCLAVRAVKSASHFLKKHKKIILISAGLAALALTLSPVTIPAIMHGNIMIGATSPALRGVATFFNGILGPVIGATKNSVGTWILASGIDIGPSVAATSLFKGLATVTAGYATLLSPLVPAAIVGIKKLVVKMKSIDFKKKKTEEKEKETKKKEPKEKKTKKKSEKARSRELLIDYLKALKGNKDLTIEEFCKQNGLSTIELIWLKNAYALHEKDINKHNLSKAELRDLVASYLVELEKNEDLTLDEFLEDKDISEEDKDKLVEIIKNYQKKSKKRG